MTTSQSKFFNNHKLKRPKSLSIFVNIGLVLLAPLLAFATYQTLGPFEQGKSSIWLRFVLLSDLIYVLLLIALALQKFLLVMSERRKKSAGSRLHLRLTGVFTLMALFPTITVAIFALLSINMGFEAWFSERVQGVVSVSMRAAKAYEDEQITAIRQDIFSLATHVNKYNFPKKIDPQTLRTKLSEAQKSIQRGLREAYLINSNGEIVLRGNRSYLFDYERPSVVEFEMTETDTVIIKDWENSELRALIKLKSFDEKAYLLVSREVNGVLLNLLDETKEAAKLYQQLERERGKKLFEFGVIYLTFAILLIVSSIFMALFFAERLSRPIGSLAGAAQKVGQGELDTRVKEEDGEDEIAQLSKYFNQMTSQLKKQRDKLLKTTEQIESRRRLFDSVLSSVTSGVLGLNADGEIFFANLSAHKLLGWGDNFINTKIEKAVPEFFPMVENFKNMESESLQEELRVVRKGRVENLLVRIARRKNEYGDLEGYVIAFDDVTDLVSAQRSAAWGDVARRIAHEIKNPLTPIKLSAERIKRKFSPELDQERESLDQLTSVIIRQTDDLRRIIDEFSKFARMPEPKKVEQELIPMIQSAITLQESGQPDVKFFFTPPKEKILLEADSTMFLQSLTNLLKNAGESIIARIAKNGNDKPKGEIRISVKKKVGRAKIIIEDNGVGFPQDRTRLFEPYVTTRDKGTGLGLAIVKKIIEEHGGNIQLDDAVAFDDANFSGASVVIDVPIKHNLKIERNEGSN